MVLCALVDGHADDEARCLGAHGTPRKEATPSRPASPDSPPDWHGICQGWYTNTESATACNYGWLILNPL